MAGAVGSLVKRMGVLNLVKIGSLPVFAYIYVQQEKEFAWLDEQKKLVNERIDDLKARGIIREP